MILPAVSACSTDTAEMLEIITDSRWFDVGYYEADVNRTLSYIGRSILFDKIEFSSFCKSTSAGMQKSLEKMIAKFVK